MARNTMTGLTARKPDALPDIGHFCLTLEVSSRIYLSGIMPIIMYLAAACRLFVFFTAAKLNIFPQKMSGLRKTSKFAR